MAVTLCSVATAQLHAGADYNSGLTTGNFETFINQAECMINMETRVNWIDEYSGLNADVKLVLELACASLAAFFAVKYDTKSFVGLNTAQNLMNANIYTYERCLSELKEKFASKFIQNAS